MERLQRISWALLLVAAGCGDDVSSGSDGSTGGDESSTGETLDPTNVTTTITPTGTTSSTSTTTDDTTGDPDTGSTTDDETTTDSTTDDTDSTDSTTSTTGDETTGEPLDCGNDMLDGREACDGVELDGQTCETLGFASGDLSCADDCTFDTAACDACGNAVIDLGEDCDGTELGDATCQSLGMGFTAGELACDATCGFDTAGCTGVPFPAAGEVIVSEIMPDPTAVSDADGEWFELHNLSDTETYQLSGCELSGQAGEEVITIDGDFQIGPDAYIAFAPLSKVDPGFTPGYAYDEAFSVANGGDVITLTCDGIVVDTVDYDAFPPAGGVSLNLDPDFFDATANDDGANWCPGVNVYLDPDTGTPGAANDECIAPAVYTIGFCRMQSPDVIAQDAGTSIDVYGRVYVAGLTDMSTSNDLAPELSAQLGYGPDGTDPAVDAGWTWIDASPNGEYTAVDEANNDEYQATLTVPAPGEYDYAYRFSGDSEASYTYCDGMPAGNSDGYQAENAGQMTAGGEVFVPDGLILAEVYYDEPGTDTNLEWVKLFNGTDAAIDLSTYSLGHGGTSYTFGTYQLVGTIGPGECFVAGGPNASANNGFTEPPAYDQALDFNPDIQNSGGTADGIALFNVTADAIGVDTIPIDAVIYGGSNTIEGDDNFLIDETGTAPVPDVGNAPDGDSIVLLSDGTWAFQADPTPTLCAFAD